MKNKLTLKEIVWAGLNMMPKGTYAISVKHKDLVEFIKKHKGKK